MDDLCVNTSIHNLWEVSINRKTLRWLLVVLLVVVILVIGLLFFWFREDGILSSREMLTLLR